ncbi:MAG: glycosyltransferase [Bacteroidia bacterium]
MLISKIIILCVLLSYLLLMLYAAISFMKAPMAAFDKTKKNHIRTCIIICARNEEASIESCLNSILEQDVDRTFLEIILVNDASEDRTLQLAEHLLQNGGVKFRIISNPSPEGKKASITKAIEACSSELIITRDADTFTNSKTWLKWIVDCYEQSGCEFIIAPLDLKREASFLPQLQAFENDALAIITAGFALGKQPVLCNGANLAFTKQLFQDLNGYTAHRHIASGDDVLFLSEVKRIRPETILYLKHPEAAVFTYPLHGVGDMIHQKVRWASKFGPNPDAANKLLGISVFLVHLFTVFFLSKALFTGHLRAFGLFFIFSRFLIDFLLLFLASRYYKKTISWLWIVPAWIAYSFFAVMIGVLSWFYKPKWK